MNSVARYDRGEVQGEAKFTDEGYIRAHAVVTRTGVFNYQNADGSIRRELRHPDDVWDEESIASMEMIPVTNGHPQERLVTAENYKRLGIGFTGETIKKNGHLVLSNLVITDHEGVDAVMNKGRKELSLGYTVDVEEDSGIYKGEPYDARQRNIRYNHLAIVDRARAGSEARIALDGEDRFEILTEIKDMSKRKIKIDNDEYMVDETTADYVDRLELDLKNLREEKARVDAEIKMIQDKLEKAEVERDTANDKLSTMSDKEPVAVVTNMDAAEFNKAVSARCKLLKTAEETLGAEVKLDGLTDQEIMKNVVAKCRKTINLDGKSDSYVQAMFDTILDEKTTKVNLDNVDFTKKNDGTAVSPVESRDKMIERQKNAHKGGK